MKKLYCNLGAKITAIVLSFVTAMIMLVSGVGTVIMGYYDFYTNSKKDIISDIFTEMAENDIYDIYSIYQADDNPDEYLKEKNIFYSIADKDGNEICSNYEGQNYIAKVSEKHYSSYSYNLYDDNETMDQYTVDDSSECTITVYVSEELKYSDKYSFAGKALGIAYDLRYTAVIITIASLVCTFALVSYLCCCVGHRKDSDQPVRNHLDYIPLDLLTVLLASVIILSFLFLTSVNTFAMMIVALPICFSIDYFAVLAYILSFASRVKTHTLQSNNMLTRLIRFLKKHLKKLTELIVHIIKNVSFVWKTAVIVCGVLILEAVIILSNRYDGTTQLFWLFIFDAAISIVAVLTAITLQRIKRGGEKIASGDLDYKINTEYIYGDFKDFSESLNNINEGLQNALNEKMKSERFKTELITNVSHDIKTPLTSIINYVDLIKKEEIENEKVKQYIEVLDRQSNRLKKLIVDLVEVSKVSTGNLAVNLTECEVGVLLAQTVGEFDERLNKAEIKPVLDCGSTPIKIMADGRHLWRVFDNLMSNICKYAQPQTRAYLDVSENNGKVRIEFKNVSKYQLNLSSEELMERFVRGDASRNTEGSGLGLSIAKSLVELQNGTMQVTVDGDLFKVTLTFDTMK